MRSLACFVLLAVSPTTAFVSHAVGMTSRTSAAFQPLAATTVSLMVDMPPAGSGRTANMSIEPCLSVASEMIEVRYKVPFGLNVEPQKNLAVCTQDGPGGEKAGDVLRYTSRWAMGLPEGEGLGATAAAFSGTFLVDSYGVNSL